jgi:biopolymer transport protein ExbD
MNRRHSNDVNAGSTADIAFLLLIFFLVTTTIQTDEGLNRKLPPKQSETKSQNIKEKNLFVILINAEGELLIEDEPIDLKDLKEKAIAFIDNGSGEGDEFCDYCKGVKDKTSSVNPQKAVISVQTDRMTKYKDYIAVQNELVAAYNTLRNREAERLYGKSYVELEKLYKDQSFKGNKALIKQKIDKIRNLYPLNISEAEPVGLKG